MKIRIRLKSCNGGYVVDDYNWRDFTPKEYAFDNLKAVIDMWETWFSVMDYDKFLRESAKYTAIKDAVYSFSTCQPIQLYDKEKHCGQIVSHATQSQNKESCMDMALRVYYS